MSVLGLGPAVFLLDSITGGGIISCTSIRPAGKQAAGQSVLGWAGLPHQNWSRAGCSPVRENVVRLEAVGRAANITRPPNQEARCYERRW